MPAGGSALARFVSTSSFALIVDTTIRIVLADDHTLVREGLRERLTHQADMEVVGEAADGWEALRLAETLVPDVLLLDMEMPGLTGPEVAQRLHEATLPVHVLALSAYDDTDYVSELLECGAAGYLTKEEALATIVEAVRSVALGEEGWLSRSVAAKVMQLQRRETTGNAASAPLLSEREIEVLQQVAQGHTNQEIATLLFISENTVRNHLANIYAKLEVHNRAEAVTWAWQHNLLDNGG